ncbi:DEAD/DEAH box helicase [bacterium LRH843]|nr:DEAD/DEAH box helicase [bacterium LRH843]
MTSNIIVHGGWLNDSFFIWGERPPRSRFDQIVNFQYPFLFQPFELKLRLFRHDQMSFYGTFIDSDKAIIDVPISSRRFSSLAGEMTVYQAEESMNRYSFPIEGLVLSFDSLVSYVPLFKTWKQQSDLEIAPDLRMWLLLFDRIQEWIKEGSFAPTPSGMWELTTFPYQDLLDQMPPSALSIRANTTIIQSQTHTMMDLKKWKEIITLISDEMIRSMLDKPEVESAYVSWEQSINPKWLPQLTQLKKQGQLENTLSTMSFQQEIGVVQTKPFLSGLALKEPETKDGAWKLSLCMVDKKQPSLMVEMGQLERGEHPWRENPIAKLKNDLAKAKESLAMLAPLKISAPVLSLNSEDAYLLFTEHDETLKKIGFRLIVPKWMTEKVKPKIKVAIEQPRETVAISEPILDWQSVADFTYTVAIGDNTISQQEFDEYVEGKRPFLYTDGEWVAWDRSLAEQLKTYLSDMQNETSLLEMWRLNQISETESDGDFDLDVSWGERLADSLKELYSTSRALISLPSKFIGELRPYQHEGVSWLAHLRRVGFGGCLADDMGLGKSIQAIVYMLYVHEQQAKEGIDRSPFLLICPTSLLYNWSHECEQFAPSLRVFIHHGGTRLKEDELESLMEWDVIITSYQLAVRDAELFHSITWNGLLLDEAQHIKNAETKQRRVIKGISAHHRIALTGTPIENRLRELWSLLDVLNPSYLGTYHDFQASFIKPIERDRDEKQLTKLQKLIHPLILRRKKSDEHLQLGLPDKREIIHNVHLSVEQAALYQAIVDDIIVRLNDVTAFERRALILRSLTKLKQICNHPAHFLKETSLDDHESGKWTSLLELTDQMVKKKEKVLIFTQYKEMGMLMAAALEKRYEQLVPFLHGSLTRAKRQEAIQSFQHDDAVSIFILSLKAGGVGLNLTAATNVIHYDRWWNPAVENQATDRAYRIGQTKDVTVHKMITVGTLEERIDRMLAEKQRLAEHILAAGEQPITELTNDEILDLIKLTK